MQSKDMTMEQINKAFELLISGLTQQMENKESLAATELWIFNQLLSLGRVLFQHSIETMVEQSDSTQYEVKGRRLKNCGFSQRSLVSVFGQQEVRRRKFYDAENKASIFPFDQEQSIEGIRFTPSLEQWIGLGATEMAYEQSVSLINKIFGLNLFGMQGERIVSDLSQYVEDYYSQKKYDGQSEGEYFAVGFDDKGVPIRPGELGRKVHSNGNRLGKGQKRDTKRNCTVSIGYSFNGRIRTPQDVISSLFKQHSDKPVEPMEEQTTAQHKHVRGFMGNKDKAIEYGFSQILRRLDVGAKPIVVLIDGDRGLEHSVDRTVQKKGLSQRIGAKILDFIHVTEYVWKAANVHWGERDPAREAWVKQQCKLILESRTDLVIGTIEELLEEHKQSQGKSRDLESVIKYLSNHIHMMDYAYYLSKGFPISTGAVESACGHFVQNRMDKNGMHWTLQGAQNMLDLRAINKNNDWDDFIQYSRCKFKLAA